MIVIDQRIWRRRLERRFDIDVGDDSSVLNIGFYHALIKYSGRKIIPVIRAGFIPLVERFWPESSFYEETMKDSEFQRELSAILDREDITMFVELIRVDIAHGADINGEYSGVPAPFLLVGGPGWGRFKGSGLLSLAVTAGKISLISALLSKFSSNAKVCDSILEHITRSKPPHIDLAIKLLDYRLDYGLILKWVLKCDELSKNQIKKLIIPLLIGVSRCIELLISAGRNKHCSYMVKKLATLERFEEACRYLFEGVYWLPSGPKGIETYHRLAVEVDRYFDLCTLKMIRSNIKKETTWTPPLLRVILGCMSLQQAPKIARFAVRHNQVVRFFPYLPEDEEICRSFLEELPLAEIRTLLGTRAKAKLKKETAIDKLLKTSTRKFFDGFTDTKLREFLGLEECSIRRCGYRACHHSPPISRNEMLGKLIAGGTEEEDDSE